MATLVKSGCRPKTGAANRPNLPLQMVNQLSEVSEDYPFPPVDSFTEDADMRRLSVCDCRIGLAIHTFPI